MPAPPTITPSPYAERGTVAYRRITYAMFLAGLCLFAQLYDNVYFSAPIELSGSRSYCLLSRKADTGWLAQKVLPPGTMHLANRQVLGPINFFTLLCKYLRKL